MINGMGSSSRVAEKERNVNKPADIKINEIIIDFTFCVFDGRLDKTSAELRMQEGKKARRQIAISDERNWAFVNGN